MTVQDAFDTTVIQSYDWSLRRLEAVESRIQHVLTLAPTLMLAIVLPTVSIAKQGQVGINGHAIAALALIGLVLIVGIVARSVGGHKFLDPSQFDEVHFQKGREEFQKDAIRWAGEHLQTNVDTIRWKSIAADFVSVLLVVATALGVAWASTVLG